MNSLSNLAQTPFNLVNLSSYWLTNLATPERSFYPLLVELMDLTAGTSVLDLGCGSGDLLAAASKAEPGAILSGIDTDFDALEIASGKIFDAAHCVQLHVGPAERLPFDDNVFDVISAALFFSAIDATGRHRATSECFRVLRPGGRLLVADWSIEGGLFSLAIRWPLDLLGRGFGLKNNRPKLFDHLRVAGFHPPDVVASFNTVLGPIMLAEVHRPNLANSE